MQIIEYFNYGRECLLFIIKKLNIKELYLPFYTCPVVWQTLRKAQCKIKFYHIDKNFMPVCDFPSSSFIIYTNYFGINSKNIEILASKYQNLIVDNAQACYMPLNYGIAGFNSSRKFFDITNSAILNIGSNQYGKMMISKDEMTQAKQKRIENFNFIHSKLKYTNELHFELTKNDVPMVYPYFNKNEVIRKKLKSNNIEIDRFWNPLPISTQEGLFQRFIIPIQLSQSTNKDEISKILNIIFSS